jgi:hypothetical protein
MRPPDATTARRPSLLVALADEDQVTLEHVARAVGKPRAQVAAELIRAALAADLPVEPDPTPLPEEAA